MNKKLLALILAGVMSLGLTACGGSQEETPAENSGEESSTQESSGATYTVGICQYAPHDALDAATQGFQDALTEAFGDAVAFELQNAAGDTPTCATIANGFVSAGVDLILANATAPLQAAVAANVSGTSDLAPLDQQAAMVKEWFPDAKTVGLLYCSAEPNSQYQVDTVQAELEKLGYTCTQYAFSDTNDMASVTQNAADNSDVIYVPTDNTCANNAGVIDNICRPAGVPIIAGEEGICGGCGVATLSISYYDLGVTTGEMAVKILTGEADISEMPIEYAPQFTKKYNEAICADLGLTVPEGYEAIA